MQTIGVIGGSGFYEMEGLTEVRRSRSRRPSARPPTPIVVGQLGPGASSSSPATGGATGCLPSEINYRANIWGMKKLGVEWLVSVSAVGSLREHIARATWSSSTSPSIAPSAARAPSSSDGVVAHVSMADPVCADLARAPGRRGATASAADRSTAAAPTSASRGPQFSTRAESHLYRSWNVDVIGMTNMPEAKLAREAELCYATLALSTDYDCWHVSEEAVTVEMVLAVMKKNIAAAQATVRELAAHVPLERTCACRHALQGAVMTDERHVSAEVKARLELILRDAR